MAGWLRLRCSAAFVTLCSRRIASNTSSKFRSKVASFMHFPSAICAHSDSAFGCEINAFETFTPRAKFALSVRAISDVLLGGRINAEFVHGSAGGKRGILCLDRRGRRGVYDRSRRGNVPGLASRRGRYGGSPPPAGGGRPASPGAPP